MRKMGKFYCGISGKIKINSTAKEKINLNAFPFDHVHKLIKYEALPATCTTAGYAAYEECPRCGHTTYVETAALGHNLIQYSEVDPTCTTVGHAAYQACSRCDYTTYQEIAALGHVEISIPAVSATCTTTGLTEGKRCSVCGATIKAQTVIPMTAHNYVDRVCTVCGYTNLEPSSGLAFSVYTSSGYAVVTGIGTCTDTDILIPSTYNGYPVKQVSSRAFKGCTNITSIMLPNSVTNIGSYAFSDCTNITSVTFSNTIDTIDTGAFAGCTALKNVMLPASIQSVSSSAFEYGTVVYWPHADAPYTESNIRAKFYTNVQEDNLYIENDIYYILDLSNKTAIISSTTNNYTATSLQLPDRINVNGTYYTVNTIGKTAFCNCATLEAAFIPTRVTYERGIFKGCSNLTTLSIALYDDLYLISSSEDIANLEHLTLLEGTTEIESSTFDYCTNLTSLSIPSSVINIVVYGFEDTKNLTYLAVDESNTVYDSRDNCNAIIETKTNKLIKGCGSTIIPNTVTSLGSNSFSNNQILKSIYIPSSVTSIYSYVFSNCNNLTSIVVDPANTVYDSRDNCNAIIKTSTNYLSEGSNSTIIPNSVTEIGAAFSGRHTLKSIIIPNSVTKVYSEAFNNCSALTSIVLSENLTSIFRLTYSYCPNLSKIIIPASVTSITESPFIGDTNLTIYCRVASQPTGWDAEWNKLSSSATIPVVWGYTGN